MVERVARGRIMVPAAAALTVMAAGAIESGSAHAAGRQATLEIRVQVVEPCRIRVAPSGALEQSCGGSSAVSAPATVRLGDLLERSAMRLPERSTRPDAPSLFTDRLRATARPEFASPAVVVPPSGTARFAAANQRAGEIAARIGQRVRFITVAY